MRMKATGPRSETEVIRLEIAKEGKSFTHLAASTWACIGDGAKRLSNQLPPAELKHLLTLGREELLVLLETLRGDEEDHQARLRSMRSRLEADR
jgi:hypothetical protein